MAGRTAYGTQFYYKNFALGINGKAEGMLETDSDAVEILTADEPKITFNESISYELPQIFKVGGKIDLSDSTVFYAEYSQISYDIGRDDDIIALGS